MSTSQLYLSQACYPAPEQKNALYTDWLSPPPPKVEWRYKGKPSQLVSWNNSNHS